MSTQTNAQHSPNKPAGHTPLRIKVADCDTQVAFIQLTTAGESIDIANLHRVMPDNVAPEYRAECLTDDQWQAVINLIDGASELKSALTEIINERDCTALADDPAYVMIDRAINKARKLLSTL